MRGRGRPCSPGRSCTCCQRARARRRRREGASCTLHAGAGLRSCPCSPTGRRAEHLDVTRRDVARRDMLFVGCSGGHRRLGATLIAQCRRKISLQIRHSMRWSCDPCLGCDVASRLLATSQV
eukprot:3622495-Rhodomonas_salina.1